MKVMGAGAQCGHCNGTCLCVANFDVTRIELPGSLPMVQRQSKVVCCFSCSTELEQGEGCDGIRILGRWGPLPKHILQCTVRVPKVIQEGGDHRRFMAKHRLRGCGIWTRRVMKRQMHWPTRGPPRSSEHPNHLPLGKRRTVKEWDTLGLEPRSGAGSGFRGSDVRGCVRE